MAVLRQSRAVADFFGADDEAEPISESSARRIAFAKDNARLFVGNIINNYAKDPERNAFSIDELSLLTSSQVDPLTLTRNVLAAVAKAANILRSCQRHAAHLKIGDLSIGTLHTECSIVRVGLQQIEAIMATNTHRSLEDRFEGCVLEEYDGVLQDCFLPFAFLGKHLEDLGLDRLEEIDRDVFTTTLKSIRNHPQMDMITQSLAALARAIQILCTAFQSQAAAKASEIMRSPEARRILASISNDSVSLYESFYTAPLIDDDDGTSLEAKIGDKTFGFDEVLSNTTLYRKAYLRQLIHSQQRSDDDPSNMQQLESANPVTMSPSHIDSIPDVASGSKSSSSTVRRFPGFEDSDCLTEDDLLISQASPHPMMADRNENFIHRTEQETPQSDNGAALPARPNAVGIHLSTDTSPASVGAPPPEKPSKLPTLMEVLSCETLSPYSLFDYYLYMRDIQKDVEYLDFWLDACHHLALCRHYFLEHCRSVRNPSPDEFDIQQLDTQTVPAEANDVSSSTTRSDKNVGARADIRACAEKILYTFILPGSEKELALPDQIAHKMITNVKDDGRYDPEVFDDAKDYVFRFMELNDFPGFLNFSRPLFRVFRKLRTLGPLVNRLTRIRRRSRSTKDLDDLMREFFDM